MAKFRTNVVLRQISKRAQTVIDSTFRQLEREAKDIVSQQIELAIDPVNSPEINSMVNSRSQSGLRAQLGLTAPTSKIRGIKKFLKDRVVVQRVGFGTRNAKLLVRLDPAYRAMTIESFAFQENNGRNGPPYLPWLDWMLTRGDSIIIKGYNVGRGQPSRSGTKTIMRKVQTGARTGLWRVPAQFSGTVTDNFISRALERRQAAYRAAVIRKLNVFTVRAGRQAR